MGKYLVKRFLQMIAVVFLVAFFTFLLVDLVPGDPVYIAAGREDLSQEQYDMYYKELNLDKNIVVRFGIWISGAVRGDFGKSYIYHQDVWDLIAPRAATTFYLAFISLLLSVPLGIVFGIITAVFRNKWPDTVITLVANISNCLPQFWVGILLLVLFSQTLNLLPSQGFYWIGEEIKKGEYASLWDHLRFIIMPVTCLALQCIAGFTRQTRSSMLEVIRSDFIRTARSKGLSERTVYFKHMLKNGLIPIITGVGARLARLMGGSMVVENIFNIPGMGITARYAVQSKDVPLIQAIVLITSLVTCVAFILTDFAYAAVDPRISLTETGD